MKCREVVNNKGERFILTEEEEKYVRALERLSKMEEGRVRLFANGKISVRINDGWYDDNIDAFVKVNIDCDGGDGGDNF